MIFITVNKSQGREVFIISSKVKGFINGKRYFLIMKNDGVNDIYSNNFRFKFNLEGFQGKKINLDNICLSYMLDLIVLVLKDDNNKGYLKVIKCLYKVLKEFKSFLINTYYRSIKNIFTKINYKLSSYLAGLVEINGSFAIYDNNTKVKKYIPKIILVFSLNSKLLV